ncbi:MAG: hypothetical protein A3F72_01370 [Bacteroidetes bacterium RIFCSPLOWO2_12_FULL_35_15]|nr:MAG: hypothetical protein A3F72_01370 [Bacteroidetes bacterium RIFCSPLOWO2_12_FULL_35_15]
MRKIIFIAVLFFLIGSETKAQQRFKAGLKVGLSTSQVAGDTYSGFHQAGFDGGGFVNGKLSEKWTAQFEIIYIQKGSKHRPDPDKGDLSSYFLRLDYVEVPVLFQYHQQKFTFEAGPGFGYLVKVKEVNDYGEITGDRPFFKTEASFNLGISYTIYKNLAMNWRYCNSFLAIRKHASGASRWYNPGQINNVLAFTLTYQFGTNESE